ncbi:GNAT family N-acetyltransferase [Paenibacillus gansuensis]|uniref:GNAT family N-acetyltransferase n=1 Tax=Paenibacillus gansuensis TaxID=306542 RepID=A0ABW5PKI9_9BACL
MVNKLNKFKHSYATRAGVTLTEAFMFSPVFMHLFPDERRRRAILSSLFPVMIRMLHAIGTVYVTSDRVEGLMCLRRHGSVRQKSTLALFIARLAVMLPGLILKDSPRQLLRRIKGMKEANTALDEYKKMHRDFAVLDAVAVHPQHQGKGLFSILMRSVLEDVERTGSFCVLQTETETNSRIYQHAGFQLVRSFPCAGGAFTTYVLLYDPHGLTKISTDDSQ